MSFTSCPNCGERKYADLGCTHCDEANYIAEQEAGTARIEAENERQRQREREAS